jgi:hypothetical protein
MAKQRLFDPDKVAYYEKAGWEAYYDRNWLRAFWLLVRLNREQFRMGLFTALSAAMDTVRASRAFAPIDNDIPTAQAHIRNFFEKARPGLNIQATPQTLAELEIDYWVVHRQLALRRIHNHDDHDIEAMTQSLANLHAALFNSTPETMRESAEYRALAAKAVDRITGKYSKDIAADWREVESYLQQAYRAVDKASDN